MKLAVTGGAGFIGSVACRHFVQDLGWQVIVLDKLTYAGHLSSLDQILGCASCKFIQIDICDQRSVRECLNAHKPDAVLHLAAETHVDRSIEESRDFVRTNVVGTHRLLEACREYLDQLELAERQLFRYVHVSTDEVYGSLGSNGEFTETSPLKPHSPYAASKAAAEQLVTAWSHTYCLPTIITRCTNNYGPHQLPEKFIPLMIINGFEGRPLPIYGDGTNVRDWLFVEDHVRALALIVRRGRPEQIYNIGGRCEQSNLAVAYSICDLIDREAPTKNRCRSLIEFVQDRPGHDLRYALNVQKIERELGWKAIEPFESGIAKTVKWYLQNKAWWKPIFDSGIGTSRLGLVNMAERAPPTKAGAGRHTIMNKH